MGLQKKQKLCAHEWLNKTDDELKEICTILLEKNYVDREERRQGGKNCLKKIYSFLNVRYM